MKRRNFLLFTLAVGVTTLPAKTKPFIASGKKILIVYYSWLGNTREIASQIKAFIVRGGKAFCFINTAGLCPDFTNESVGFVISGSRVSSAANNVIKWLQDIKSIA